MVRHKEEKHEDPKKCPWCGYCVKRSDRLFKHVDEKHRAKKQINPRSNKSKLFKFS